MSRGTLALAFFLLGVSLCGSASALVVRCPDAAVTVNLNVFYGNGMFTSGEQARDSLRELRRRVPAALGYEEAGIAFDVAYNFDEPVVDQLLEVATQKLAEAGPRMVLHYLSRGVTRSLPDSVLNFISEQSQAIAFIHDEDLRAQVRKYEDALRAGRNVLVVSHSQGNLYANAARARVFRGWGGLGEEYEDHFSIVGVASPASYVAGPAAAACSGNCYTTLVDDIVMAAVRAADSETLAGNVSDPGDATDWMRHAFVAAYMTLPRARKQVLEQIAAQVEAFPDLEETFTSGAISATLAWPPSADMDLHVYEADRRSHVYYDRTAGLVGYLDADSRTGGAEVENYFADCADLREGVYEFGVGYFDGEGPLDAQLHLQVDGHSYFLQTGFDGPLGAAADRAPRILARLEIERRDARTFVVRPIE